MTNKRDQLEEEEKNKDGDLEEEEEEEGDIVTIVQCLHIHFFVRGPILFVKKIYRTLSQHMWTGRKEVYQSSGPNITITSFKIFPSGRWPGRI